jgi:hypothetical protein
MREAERIVQWRTVIPEGERPKKFPTHFGSEFARK